LSYAFTPKYSGFFVAEKIEKKFMELALQLAEKGRGLTRPNPLVGAVIVKNGRVIGKGYHRRAGGPHAEVIALREAGKAARNSTLFVNLEPCCHTGLTGPCTERIITAGIKRVVFSTHDPDRRVSGKGARSLRRAGLKVKSGLLRKQARLMNDIFFGYHETKRPFVILKSAQTLDGRIATANGDSRWITSLAARKFAHRLRSEVDAVAVGMGTVIKDNPRLTVRHVKGGDPYRIVLTASMKFPTKCHLIDNNSDFKTIVAGPPEKLERFARSKRGRGVIGWKVRGSSSGLDIKDFLEKAALFGIRSILIEGGAGLATAFLKAGLVDKYVAITAPVLLGTGVNAVGELGIRSLSEAIKFKQISIRECGSDSIFTGYPARKDT